jgi:hypothetical protein
MRATLKTGRDLHTKSNGSFRKRGLACEELDLKTLEIDFHAPSKRDPRFSPQPV